MLAQCWDAERAKGSGRSIRAAWWNMSEAAQRPQTMHITSPASAVWRRLRACWGNSSMKLEPFGPKWFCHWTLTEAGSEARALTCKPSQNLHPTGKLCSLSSGSAPKSSLKKKQKKKQKHIFVFMAQLPWRWLLGLKRDHGWAKTHSPCQCLTRARNSSRRCLSSLLSRSLRGDTTRNRKQLSKAVFAPVKPIVCVHEGKCLSADI